MSIFNKLFLFRLFHKHPRYFFYLISHKLRLARRYKWVKKNLAKPGLAPVPFIFEIFPTLKCNLHCRMCNLWGNSGWCQKTVNLHNLPELPLDVLKKLFQQVARWRPSFFLNGGGTLNLFPFC